MAPSVTTLLSAVKMNGAAKGSADSLITWPVPPVVPMVMSASAVAMATAERNLL